MNKMLCLAPLALATLGLMACGSDNGGNVVDAGPVVVHPDAEAMDASTDCMQPTFTDIHAKILRGPSCVPCHSTAPGLGSIFFATDKAASYATVMGDSINGTTPPKRVVANQPDQSSFYLKLTATPPFGDRMPQALPALTTCEILAVQQWINNGAMND